MSTKKSLILVALLMNACASGEAPTSAEGTVNRALGDASYHERFGHNPAPDEDDTRRVVTHLSHVESLLRARDVSSMPDELRLARARNLDRLHDYWMEGRFPRNHPGEARHPRFVDDDDEQAGLEDAPRICAVGHLFALDRGVDAARAVAARYQEAHVPDIGDEALLAWAATSGLAHEELAMIQPSYGWIGRPEPRPVRPAASPAAVQGVLAALEPRINRCVLDHLAATDAHPSEIRGTVVVGGQRTKSVKLDTGLKAHRAGVERCIASVAANTLFPFDFKAGDITATQRWAILGPIERGGGFRLSYAPELMRRATPAVERCAQHLPALSRATQVLVDVQLAPEGKLTASRLTVTAGSPSSEAFEGCVKTAIAAVAGPGFKGNQAKFTHLFIVAGNGKVAPSVEPQLKARSDAS